MVAPEYFGLLNFFYQETGKTRFTYNALRRWYYKSDKGYKLYKRDWHTVERNLRKMAEEGFLNRYYYDNGKVVVFELNEAFFKYLEVLV